MSPLCRDRGRSGIDLDFPLLASNLHFDLVNERVVFGLQFLTEHLGVGGIISE